jgi:hypothetical protein
MLKSGNIYKLGEGPINYGWNLRFFVLDGNSHQFMIERDFVYRIKLGLDLLLK